MGKEMPHDAAGLRPLTARSVVLSVLLGAHPPRLPVRDLVRTGDLFGISDRTLRVALTRMVAAGDVLRDGSTYGLSDRLVARQRRQDEAVAPRTVESWDGSWDLVAITATGRGPAERAALRDQLTALRLAELREGLWLRPANLRREWPPPELTPVAELFTGAPRSDAEELAATLWDLNAWSTRATALLRILTTATDPADRFTAAAASVRHLLGDPVLPPDLLPRNWPATELREAYRAFQSELIALAQRAR
ncbi:PaaX domain-containing protein, C- domain protein [Streptomyces sp. A7024]|uniref:PaaX domain-containing protein, C-domain protein n=1 Tax=Streptomyces coryli TaxID=1128680 RepID=A0A6G4UDF9_9ACTN|nr:PaaX family transcriptional regulator C-terminal domain-containing protein [Streptomyces coryli]NGN70204.1 PaaX domain-containing protein, C- domain protein [Streptomyces coryli]